MVFLFFILLPIIELYLLIEVGAQIGALTTIVWIFASIFIGWSILKIYNLTAMLNYQQIFSRMQTGMANEVFLVLSGILLIIPGFLTDFIGILCLLPTFRHILIAIMVRRLFRNRQPRDNVRRRKRADDPDIIEGKFKHKD